MGTIDMDSRIKVKVIGKTPNPQQVIYAAMHQDYSERFVADEYMPNEETCGDIIVKHLLAGERGHYGPLEHVQITFNVGYFPHSVMQQARTHRIASFDCQSMRYTGSRIASVNKGDVALEDVFYLRPVGHYTNRQGKKYEYTDSMRTKDIAICFKAAQHYEDQINEGLSEEHARGMIPFDFRQHFVVSFNLRSVLHFMDLRSKRDAQLEIQWMCEKMWPYIEEWVPAIADWYQKTRMGKARLAP